MNTRELSALMFGERSALAIAEGNGIPLELVNKRLRSRWSIDRAITEPRHESPHPRWAGPRPGRAEFTPAERAIMRGARVTGSLAKRRMRAGMGRVEALATPAPKHIPTPAERAAMAAAGVSRQLWDARMANGWDREKATGTPPNKYTRPRKHTTMNDLPQSPSDSLRWRAMREPGSMKPGHDTAAEEPPWREETFAHDPGLGDREGGADDALAELARTATAPLLACLRPYERASRLYVVRDGSALWVPGTDWQSLFDRDLDAYLAGSNLVTGAIDVAPPSLVMRTCAVTVMAMAREIAQSGRGAIDADGERAYEIALRRCDEALPSFDTEADQLAKHIEWQAERRRLNQLGGPSYAPTEALGLVLAMTLFIEPPSAAVFAAPMQLLTTPRTKAVARRVVASTMPVDYLAELSLERQVVAAPSPTHYPLAEPSPGQRDARLARLLTQKTSIADYPVFRAAKP